jgi:dipeptidyl aminopeptidase/acylaminoacyl peptidase
VWKKIVKRTVLVLIALVLVFGVVMAVIGLPRPAAITAENLPRIPWRFVVDNYKAIRLSIDSTTVSDWYPDGESLLIWAKHGLMERRAHRLAALGADPEFLAALPRTARGVTLNPREDYLVFRKDADGDEAYQIYRWDYGTEAPEQITGGKGRHLLGEFDAEGERLAYTSTERNDTDYDLYIVDPARPESAERVFTGEGHWSAGPWSPEGDALLIWNYVSAAQSQIYRFVLADRSVHPVGNADGPVAFGDAEWGPDGVTLFYVSDAGAEFKRLRRLDLETGEEQIVGDEIEWDVQGLDRSHDGSLLAISINEDGVNRVLLYDVATDAVRPLGGLPAGLIRGVDFHPSENRLAINHTDPTGLTRIYVHDLDTGTWAAWTHADRPMESDLPEPRLVHYETFDTVDGVPRMISAFVYPAAEDTVRPSPVMIDIHGGPEGQSRLGYDPIMAQVRRKGITIISPNVRGSSGYGKTFLTLDNGYLREDSVKDIGALLDWIAGQHELDEDRVAVFGGSYGGYMVLASLVHFGDRIRCGVELFGISNFVTFLENTRDYRRDLRRVEYGDERDPEMRAFLESISPANHTDRLRSPLFVYGGANDPRVPVGESRQIVEKVREAGTEVWYVEAANEGHGLDHPLNGLYVGSAAFVFMEQHLLQ